MATGTRISFARQKKSLYHSLCHTTICYVRAIMTFNPDDIDITIQAVRQTVEMAKKYEPYKPWISFRSNSKSPMDECSFSP